MGLRETRIINSVHPWLGVRLKWLAEVSRILGGGQNLISGNRTSSEQSVLWQRGGSRPVARPGCSQHQYGYAADATWLPFATINSKGRLKVTRPSETNAIMEGHARRAGLTTVTGDPGHLQIYPAGMFLLWATGRNLCPDPAWPRLDLARASSFAFRDCLLAATSANREGFRGQVSCPLPCGPLFGTPCV